MLSFFNQPFEGQVYTAIYNNDAKLVQVLLGPKYCQLWQYWLVHGKISFKALNMERITHSKLFLSIVDKQTGILDKQKKLLEERRDFLRNRDANREDVQVPNQEQIKESRHLVRDLLSAIQGAVTECKNNIVTQSNQGTDYREFYIPHNLLNDQYNTDKDLEYVFKEISTISSAEILNLTDEINSIISEFNKEISNNVWEQGDISTRIAYYLGKIVDKKDAITGGDNGRLLDQAVYAVPENMNIRGTSVPSRSVVAGFVTILKLIPGLYY